MWMIEVLAFASVISAGVYGVMRFLIANIRNYTPSNKLILLLGDLVKRPGWVVKPDKLYHPTNVHISVWQGQIAHTIQVQNEAVFLPPNDRAWLQRQINEGVGTKSKEDEQALHLAESIIKMNKEK